MPRHIVLIGPMGVGKTALGSYLATSLQSVFLDSDVSLTQAENVTGRALVASEGVAKLHAREHDFLREALRWPDNAVIAAAASCADEGALLRSIHRDGHLLVYLDAEEDELTPLADDASHRRPIPLGEATQLHIRRRAAALDVEATIFRPRGFPDAESAAAGLLVELSLLDG